MSHGSGPSGSHRSKQGVRELRVREVNHYRFWCQVQDKGYLQYSESLVTHALPLERKTIEAVNIDVETASNKMCSNHGRAARYEFTLLERRLLSYG